MASIQTRKETGNLIIDFYFQGHRCREHTALKDTAPNRKRLQKVLDRIEAEIAAGTFEYGKYFPNSKNAARLEARASSKLAAMTVKPVSAAVQASLTPTPLFRDFAEVW